MCILDCTWAENLVCDLPMWFLQPTGQIERWAPKSPLMTRQPQCIRCIPRGAHSTGMLIRPRRGRATMTLHLHPSRCLPRAYSSDALVWFGFGSSPSLLFMPPFEIHLKQVPWLPRKFLLMWACEQLPSSRFHASDALHEKMLFFFLFCEGEGEKKRVGRGYYGSLGARKQV